MLLRVLAILVTTGAVATAAPGALAADPPLAAPPASAAASAACGAKATAAARTADVERVVRGVGQMGGCVTDATGIAHMFLQWTSKADDSTGRICVDPVIRANAWSCTWDTTTLSPGSFTVTMVAVDAAGNRGSFDQAYRVAAAPATDEPAPDATPTEPVAPPAATAAPEPSTEANTEPSADAATTLPTTPLAPLLASKLEECAQLELAPGVLADRALSVAVLECMRPAIEATGSADMTLDEIPVPPAIQIIYPDAAALHAADELLPDSIGGVGLELVLAPTVQPAQ